MPEAPTDDTGLRCPWCDYNLTALTSDTCPECGKRFVITRPSIVNRISHRSFRITESGLICTSCGHENTGFMPRRCKACGHPFTWAQRVFGSRFVD